MKKERTNIQEKPRRTTFRIRMEEMLNTIRDNILTGQLQKGDYLPSLQHLSKQYKLSINSVQKGLDELVSEALIERVPRIGIRVTDSSSHSIVTISFGYYPSLMGDADLDHLISSFHAEHPRIRVNLIPLQYENYLDAVNHYLHNEILDVLSINYINFNQFVAHHSDLIEVFEPLQPNANLYPFLAQPFTHSGQLFVQPFIFSPVILCYNKQHFAEGNVPEPAANWKWNDLMSCLDRLNNPEDHRLAFYFYPATYNRWPIFLLQSGNRFERDASGRIGFTAPDIMDSIQTIHDMIRRQKMFPLLLSENDANVEQLFSQQKVSIIITTYFNLNKLRHVSFPFDIAPLPHVHVPKTLLLTIGIALNRRSKHKEASKIFIDFLGSYTSQLHIRKQTCSIPALQEAAEWTGEESGNRSSQFGLYRDISHTFSLLTELNMHQHEIDQLLNAMNGYWMGIHSKEDLVDQLSSIGSDGL